MLLLNIAQLPQQASSAAQAQSTVTTPLMVEIGLTLIAIAISFCLPRLGNTWFTRIEQFFSRLASRRGLAVATVGASAMLLRLAILPLIPIPLPFAPDDFSFLLAADTFASGRVTNPTPPMWVHFESIHITMTPSYMSMYFPAQGLLLAAGKVLFGNPWFGLLLGSGLMCAAICWALQAWLPAKWAFLGGMIAVIHLGLFSYWINTYHAGGSIAALGGALVLGSLPRLTKTARFRYGLLMAIGIVLLVMSRPYEGMLLCLPVAFVLGRWLWKGSNRPPAQVLLRRAVIPVAVMILGGAWMAHYDKRAFGHASTPPYAVDRAQYAMAPYFVWQSPRPEPGYRHAMLRNFYYDGELKYFFKVHSRTGYLPATLIKGMWAAQFYAGVSLLPALFMVVYGCRDRRIRFLVLLMPVLVAGMVIQIYLIPHYLAPFTVAFYAIGLQCLRHLRQWRPEGKPVGLTMVRLCVTLCLVMAGLRLYAGPLHLGLAEWPAGNWNFEWYGPDHFGTERARVADQLSHMQGQQLVLVRYADNHNPFEEWVYNAPDIDASKVIWAREMDDAHNAELLRYYKGRHIWLAQPDTQPAALTPYVGAGQTAEAPPDQMFAKNR